MQISSQLAKMSIQMNGVHTISTHECGLVEQHLCRMYLIQRITIEATTSLTSRNGIGLDLKCSHPFHAMNIFHTELIINVNIGITGDLSNSGMTINMCMPFQFISKKNKCSNLVAFLNHNAVCYRIFLFFNSFIWCQQDWMYLQLDLTSWSVIEKMIVFQNTAAAGTKRTKKKCEIRGN